MRVSPLQGGEGRGMEERGVAVTGRVLTIGVQPLPRGGGRGKEGEG